MSTSRSNTPKRIIEVSLKLFNEQGERNISTNHIANHMGISPGNLYYHFSNKDEIIVQLFKRYSGDLFEYLNSARLPETITQSVEYMENIYEIMWNYRFLFSDVNSLLLRSAELLGQHNEFTRTRIAPLLVKLLSQLNEHGVLAEIDEIGKNDLAVQMWLITKYWFDFDSSLKGIPRATEDAKERGVYRTLSLLRPYMPADKRAEFDQMFQNSVKTAQ